MGMKGGWREREGGGRGSGVGNRVETSQYGCVGTSVNTEGGALRCLSQLIKLCITCTRSLPSSSLQFLMLLLLQL